MGIWIDQAIIGRDGRVLMDKSISEMVKPIGKNRKEFGAYHMLLQELDARNLREKHQMEYEARKAKMHPFNPSLISKYEREETELDVGSADCASGVCPVR